MAATSSNVVYEAASIAQEHVEQNAEVKVLLLHHIGGMKSTGSTAQGCNAVHLAWLLVCVRCQAAVCCYIYGCTSRILLSLAGETFTRIIVELPITVFIIFYSTV